MEAVAHKEAEGHEARTIEQPHIIANIRIQQPLTCEVWPSQVTCHGWRIVFVIGRIGVDGKCNTANACLQGSGHLLILGAFVQMCGSAWEKGHGRSCDVNGGRGSNVRVRFLG